MKLMEMAAKKHCDKCGKTMAANHFWYKGGWRCKKSATADADEPAESKDKFPHMSDEAYDKLSKAEKQAQDAKEAEWYKRNGRTPPKDYTPRDANDEAALNRQRKLVKSLSRK